MIASSHLGAGDGSVGLFDIRTCGGITRLPLGSNCEVNAPKWDTRAITLQSLTQISNISFYFIDITVGHVGIFQLMWIIFSSFKHCKYNHCLGYTDAVDEAWDKAC